MANDVMEIRGMRRVTDRVDGSLGDCPADWPGILAMLLRKVTIDQYDGKTMPDAPKMVDEKLTYTQLVEMAEDMIRHYGGERLSDSEIRTEMNRLLTEFSRERVSIKVLGEFLSLIDFEWVDVKLVGRRKSGTTKAYTVHIGGVGKEGYTQPEYDDDYIETMGIHKESISVSSNTEKKLTRPKKQRAKRNTVNVKKLKEKGE